ncbi:uracil-DNA glycosylase [Thermocoleostomius sinensis]|jgi:DNA polymerase|uniref:Type-4 uracil-DNA glycosylase n=1 Tax=Thermocoleostomius sinensis A174 TaxID=2016057 RepID=A0A9E8ZKH4_9CYAN|nr:uracil-DNA glycosylase [Thermocoleostomius sinensis]WAL60161.1 uracil-DNA glycosylase [Thermocoleostomius sinensis A174]
MAIDNQMDLFGSTELATVAPNDFNPDLIPTSAKVPIPSGTYTDMEQMKVHCNQCQRCELGATRTHAVVWRGNLHADLMIVGEGPGQNEDETGLPFVGKAGQLLDKILASVNLTEDDVFICNIVKCRPPGNRTPTQEEMDACRPYILEQIRMVDPKIILLSGASAVRGLTGDKRGITKIRGEWIEWNDRLCMPVFHPAYLLRNPSKERGSPKWYMWQDIQAVRAKLDEVRGAGIGG